MPEIVTFIYCVQENHCVQQNTVSNTFRVSSSLMCPQSFESTLVQISVVNMLRSYHAALGGALYVDLAVLRICSSIHLEMFSLSVVL